MIKPEVGTSDIKQEVDTSGIKQEVVFTINLCMRWLVKILKDWEAHEQLQLSE